MASLAAVDEIARVCDACGSQTIGIRLSGLVHAYKDGATERRWLYRLLYCRDCGLGMVDPSPNPEVLNSIYTSEYGNYQAAQGDGGLSPAKMRLARMRFSQHPLERAVAALVELGAGRTLSATLGLPLQLPKEAAILDVGYGNGGWLSMMRSVGYRRLYGYDIDANEAARERLTNLGVEVTSGDFLASAYPANSFDCIRMCHVFEHVVDPEAVLAKCFEMLRQGGVLVMEHPCFKSWMTTFSIEHSPGMQLPTHLFHHTRRSTRLILEAAGFEVERVRSFGVPLQFICMMNNKRLAEGRRSIPPKTLQPFGPLYSALNAVTGRGDFLHAWARKPGVSGAPSSGANRTLTNRDRSAAGPTSDSRGQKSV